MQPVLFVYTRDVDTFWEKKLDAPVSSRWIKTASYGLVFSSQGSLNSFHVRIQCEYPQMDYCVLLYNGEYAMLRLPERSSTGKRLMERGT